MATPIRFYKKFSPGTRIQLADGRFLEPFKTVYPNDVTGYYATNNPGLQGYFTTLMEQGRYALSEITEEEFHRDYVQKKNQPQRPAWREELGKNSAGLTLPQEPVARLAEEGRLSVVEVKGCDQPGRPCGVSMEETPAAAAIRQAGANASIAQAIAQPPKPVPAAGRRARGTRPPAASNPSTAV